jgi:hypothetical protein
VRKFVARVWIVPLALLLVVPLAAIALVTEEGVEVHERFTPDRLGASTNLSLTARLSPTSALAREPVHKFTVYGPAGLRIDARGAGTCTAATLEQAGPTACPADSRVGFGGGVGALQLSSETVRERYTLDFFFSSTRPGHLSLLIHVSATAPANIELTLIAREVQAAPPYGLGFSVEVPPISTIPGAEAASIETAFATLGAADVAYYRRLHGRRRLVRLRGLVVPSSCPPGGFPTRAIVQFASGRSQTLDPTVPCPA